MAAIAETDVAPKGVPQPIGPILSDDEVIELVCEACGSEAKGLVEKRRKVVALGERSVPYLIGWLGADNHGIQVDNASDLLVKIGRPAVPALIEAMNRGVGRDGGQAAWVLGKIGDRRAVEPLILALQKDYTWNKYDKRNVIYPLGGRHAGAAGGLGLIGDKRAVKPLIAALKNDSPLVRAQAARSLGRLEAVEAVAALEELSRNDKGGEVRTASREALRRVRNAR